jgi:CDP-4-dehydro-6-deoxyglucose reductase
MLEECFTHGLRHPVALYWGGRRPQDIYLHELAENWARSHPLFSYNPVVSEAQATDHWHGRTGLVHQAVLADIDSLAAWRIVVGGSPAMVYAIFDDFVAAGMAPEQMISDVFDYAPRAGKA